MGIHFLLLTNTSNNRYYFNYYFSTPDFVQTLDWSNLLFCLSCFFKDLEQLTLFLFSPSSFYNWYVSWHWKIHRTSLAMCFPFHSRDQNLWLFAVCSSTTLEALSMVRNASKEHVLKESCSHRIPYPFPKQFLNLKSLFRKLQHSLEWYVWSICCLKKGRVMFKNFTGHVQDFCTSKIVLTVFMDDGTCRCHFTTTVFWCIQRKIKDIKFSFCKLNDKISFLKKKT